MNHQILFNSVPRVSWRKKETPLDIADKMGQDLGVNLYIKREDTCDDFACGNKVRKLEYILSDAIQKKATRLITWGSTQSNQCKAVAIAGKKLGIPVHLIYGGDDQTKPEIPTGNYLITTLFSPTITWFERYPWSRLADVAEEIRLSELEKGEIPYVIPAGASAWPGILGSVDLGLELYQQLKSSNVTATRIIAPAGSCGTCTGINIASSLMKADWKVYGICIASSRDWAEECELDILQSMYAALDTGPFVKQRVHFIDDCRGSGYDKHTPGEIQLIKDVSCRYQLLFDPNYMIKAYIGLRTLVENGTINKGENVVLIHTGGQFGLFASTPALINCWV